MNQSRRSFVRSSALAVAGAALLPKLNWAQAPAHEIVGIQLYSLRDDMKRNPLETLTVLSKMGYKHVEHANYIDRKFYGYSAVEFKKVLGDLGLQMPSGHTVMNKDHWDAGKKEFTQKWIDTVADAATVGQTFVISPWLDEDYRKNIDDLKGFLDVFNKSGALCKEHGMKFGYHNHNFEFSSMLEGKPVYDIILENTDPELVIQQIDMGNMYGAGGRAFDIIKRFPGRFASMHVKDEIKSAKGEMDDGYESTVLGKGLIDVKKVIDEGRNVGGTKHFIIEQESYQTITPLQAAKEDLQIMRRWGYKS